MDSKEEWREDGKQSKRSRQREGGAKERIIEQEGQQQKRQYDDKDD